MPLAVLQVRLLLSILSSGGLAVPLLDLKIQLSHTLFLSERVVSLLSLTSSSPWGQLFKAWGFWGPEAQGLGGLVWLPFRDLKEDPLLLSSELRDQGAGSQCV